MTVGKKKTTIPAPVKEELAVLERVRHALELAPRPGWVDHHDRELLELRDALGEEKLPDDRASLLEQMDRVAAVAKIREKHAPNLINSQSPYFARMLLEYDDGRRSEILLGSRSFFADGVRIVDWRHAPISQIFYRYREGERFDEEIAGRRVTGKVALRRSVTIVNGQLVRVVDGSRTYQLSSGGWLRAEKPGSRLEGGAGTASRPDNTKPVLGGADLQYVQLQADRRLAAITSLLDRDQFDLLCRDPEQLLVITGGAGSGKTTVGLHRVAWLHFTEPERFRPGRMMVLVYGKALARYVERVLPALGVEGVEVRTMRSWAVGQLHKHFGDISRHIIDETPADVVRAKSHPALIPMLEDAAAAAPAADPKELFDELFTDLGWLREGFARYAPGEFDEAQIRSLHDWCTRLQFARADGEARDEIPPGYDEEDLAILLRLYQLLKGPLQYSRGRRLGYDHLMVDEAQDFSALELRVLLDTVKGESITLAGDRAQRLAPGDPPSWHELIEVLPVRRHEIARLAVSYRCTRQVMELARQVLGPLADGPPPVAQRDGPPAAYLRFGQPGAAFAYLADALADLQKREPQALVGVLAPNIEQA
ncbi:MAG: hypothetical protein D6806_11000, partial [Deltaproteobacteria bacterium]